MTRVAGSAPLEPRLRFDFEHVETRCPPLKRDAEGVTEPAGRPVQLFAGPLVVFVEHDAAVIGLDARGHVDAVQPVSACCRTPRPRR